MHEKHRPRGGYKVRWTPV